MDEWLSFKCHPSLSQDVTWISQGKEKQESKQNMWHCAHSLYSSSKKSPQRDEIERDRNHLKLKLKPHEHQNNISGNGKQLLEIALHACFHLGVQANTSQISSLSIESGGCLG